MAKSEYLHRITLSRDEIIDILCDYCQENFGPEDSDNFPKYELEFDDHLDITLSGDSLAFIASNKKK